MKDRIKINEMLIKIVWPEEKFSAIFGNCRHNILQLALHSAAFVYQGQAWIRECEAIL